MGKGKEEEENKTLSDPHKNIYKDEKQNKIL
jgi:hypothetical protein